MFRTLCVTFLGLACVTAASAPLAFRLAEADETLWICVLSGPAAVLATTFWIVRAVAYRKPGVGLSAALLVVWGLGYGGLTYADNREAMAAEDVRLRAAIDDYVHAAYQRPADRDDALLKVSELERKKKAVLDAGEKYRLTKRGCTAGGVVLGLGAFGLLALLVHAIRCCVRPARRTAPKTTEVFDLALNHAWW